jgi:hypothetical protein
MNLEKIQTKVVQTTTSPSSQQKNSVQREKEALLEKAAWYKKNISHDLQGIKTDAVKVVWMAAATYVGYKVAKLFVKSIFSKKPKTYIIQPDKSQITPTQQPIAEEEMPQSKEKNTTTSLLWDTFKNKAVLLAVDFVIEKLQNQIQKQDNVK